MQIEPKSNMDEFQLSAKAMKCAEQLLLHPSDREAYARRSIEIMRETGESLEAQRDRRNPRWRESLEIFQRRKKTTVLYY